MEGATVCLTKLLPACLNVPHAYNVSKRQVVMECELTTTLTIVLLILLSQNHIKVLQILDLAVIFACNAFLNFPLYQRLDGYREKYLSTRGCTYQYMPGCMI